MSVHKGKEIYKAQPSLSRCHIDKFVPRYSPGPFISALFVISLKSNELTQWLLKLRALIRLTLRHDVACRACILMLLLMLDFDNFYKSDYEFCVIVHFFPQ